MAWFGDKTTAKLGGPSAELATRFARDRSSWRKSGLLVDRVDSKPCNAILDGIDQVSAHHSGFTADELDLVINDDVRYRMGVGDQDVPEQRPPTGEP